MIQRLTRSILILAASLLAAQAHAQVYKCVDAKGKTVYSQDPCPAGAASKVLDARPPTRTPDPAAKDAAKGDPSKAAAAKDAKKGTPEEEFQKRQQERAEAEKKAADQLAEQKRKEDDCRRAREQVAQYDAGGRIARIDSKGERYFLEDNQVAQEKAKWQAQADQACR